MANVRITIEATGGVEGCGGDPNADANWCGRSGCPHCLTRGFLMSLKSTALAVTDVRIDLGGKPVAAPGSKTPPGLLPTKEEFVAAGYLADRYEEFIEQRTAEIAAIVKEAEAKAAAAAKPPEPDAPATTPPKPPPAPPAGGKAKAK